MSTAGQKAYDKIRDAILSGELAAGRHLTEADLAKSVGVSRTPVRDALLRLSTEGLVEMQRNHGATVRSFSERDIFEIFELRATLESFSAKWAAKNISEDALRELEELARKMETMPRPRTRRQLRAFAQLNTRFHQCIVDASASKLLDGLLTQLIEMPLMDLKEGSWQSQVNFDKTNKQHREIIEALRSRSQEWSASAMYAHVISTRPPQASDQE